MPNKTLTIGSVSNPVDIGITGTLTAPTPTSGSSSNQVATKSYVDSAVNGFSITANGILKGDGSGNITAATAGTDYAAASHNHSASNITSGTLDWARLPGSRIYDATASRTANTILAAPNGSAGAASFRALATADIPNLDAGKITSGTFADARIPNLGAGKITSGTFAIARIPTNNAQSNSTATVPTSALVYGMNTRLTSIETNGVWEDIPRPTPQTCYQSANWNLTVNYEKMNSNSGMIKVSYTIWCKNSSGNMSADAQFTSVRLPQPATDQYSSDGNFYLLTNGFVRNCTRIYAGTTYTCDIIYSV